MDDRNPDEWSPFFDMRGIPICAGDLIRSDHFVDFRGKKHYLYHVAVREGERWYMVPTCWLDPKHVKGGGKCRIEAGMGYSLRVIHGCGPGDYLDYTDRPRKPKEA